MFKNNKVNLVLSIIIAVVIWAYVVGQVNPQTTKTFSSIKVEFVNSNDLLNEGLAMVKPENNTINVTVSGKRAAVKKIDSGDIKATVDLKDCGRGKNKIAVQVKVPKNIKVSKTDPETITVDVENIVTEKKKVKAVFTGLADNEEASGTVTDPTVVNVTGAESQVKKVSYVRARVDAGKIKDSNGYVTASAVPVDSHGHQVKYVQTADKYISVKSGISQTKDVKLIVNVTGSVDSSVQLVKTDVPEKAVIKGKKSVLKSIKSLTAEDVSISGVSKNTSIPLKLELPDGVELADGYDNLAVKVTVSALSSKKLDFTTDDVTVSGLSDSQTHKFSATDISAVVKGSDSAVSDLTKADVKLTADLSGLDTGTHKVKIKASVPDGISDISLYPSTVEVTISK